MFPWKSETFFLNLSDTVLHLCVRVFWFKNQWSAVFVIVLSKVCQRRSSQCCTCAKLKPKDQKLVRTRKHDYAQTLNEGEFIALPQRIRVDVFAHFWIRLKLKSIMCHECHALSPTQLRKQIMPDASFLESLSEEDLIPHQGFKHKQTKSIMISVTVTNSLTKMKFWTKNRNHHMMMLIHSKIKIDWNSLDKKLIIIEVMNIAKTMIAQIKRKTPKHRTNRRIMGSVLEILQQDCYDLCSTTRDQL